MSTRQTRRYVSDVRSRAADATRARLLHAAKTLFARRGIDRVTIAEIAKKAGVSASTVYAIYQSKEGILRELMSRTLFGQPFQRAMVRLQDVTDPERLIELTAKVARAVYEEESAQLGLMRGASAFSAALRQLESEFEAMRFMMQRERVERLFARHRQRKGLTLDEARRILWMYTSRDVYRLLVQEGGWTPARYEEWLAETLVSALVEPLARGRRSGTSQSSTA